MRDGATATGVAYLYAPTNEQTTGHQMRGSDSCQRQRPMSRCTDMGEGKLVELEHAVEADSSMAS